MAKFFCVPTDSSCFSLKISVKSKRKVFTSADVLWFPENIGEEQKKGLQVCRCPVFPENIDEEQKKVFRFADVL